MPDVSEVAVEPCARFIGDQSQPFWTDTSSDKIEAFFVLDVVQFLEKLGPKASEALPSLEKALEHSDTRMFVPAVVNAITAIGTPEAVEVLRKVSGSERSEVRHMVEQALKTLNKRLTK